MYIPKNKIITNLYTGDGSFVVKTTGEIYKGFYYKTFNGKYFTGKTPNNPPNIEIEQILVDDSTSNLPQSKIVLDENPTITDYTHINNIDLNKPQSKYLPIQSYPTPTEDDYKLGVFTRYFCVKINEDKYIELSKEVYGKLVGKDSEYLWEPYTPFKLQWTITGELDYVVNTNRNIILLTEKRLKRRGLDVFLRGNYDKFYST